MKARNFNEVKRALRNREEFTHTSMSGKWHDVYAPSSDRNLLTREVDRLIADNGRGVYVVKSYNTIVAYVQFDVDGSVIACHIEPNVYSVTTSRHTGYVRNAWEQLTA